MGLTQVQQPVRSEWHIEDGGQLLKKTVPFFFFFFLVQFFILYKQSDDIEPVFIAWQITVKVIQFVVQ